MIKRIIIGIVAVAIGFGFSLLAYSFFREQIENIYFWSTSNRIRFFGKNFYLFGSDFYNLSFGIAFLIFTFRNLNLKLKNILKNGILSILIFVILVIGISSVDANLKVLQCTSCDDGIVTIRWSRIKYDLILGTSVLLSVIPSLILIIRKLKKANIQQRV